MGPFEYLEPLSLEEAVSLLSKYGHRAKILAGGTDLVPSMKERTVNPEYIINLGRIPSLDFIRVDKNGLRIGALTTVRSIEQAQELRPKYRLLAQAAGQLASTSIRNVATIGGNLCNCSPSADTAPALLALSAKTQIVGTAGGRVISLEQFLRGPGTTALKPDELLTEIQIPAPPPSAVGVYIKFSTRGGEDLALVGVAALVTLEDGLCTDIKITLGAVAPTAIRAYRAETILKRTRLSRELIEQAARIAAEESKPIDDVRGSAEYRREMIKVLTRDAVMQAAGLAKP